MKKMSFKTYLTFLMVILIIFNFVITQYSFFPLLTKALTPLLLGFVIAYLIDPLVLFLIRICKEKLKRNYAILISIIIILSFLVLFGAILVPSMIGSAVDIVEKINYYFENQFNLEFFENLLGKVSNEIAAEIILYINNSIKEILLKIGELSSVFINALVSFILSLSSSLISIFMAFVISIYMLVDKKDLLLKIKRLNYAVNEKELADVFYKIAKKSDEIFSSFFIGKMIDSTIIGLLCFMIMWIFKIPNSPAIGFIIGLTNIIPYFGPFIGAVPVLIITLASGTLFQVVLVAVIIIILQQFDGLFLGPKILGDKIGVGAFWIIVSVSVGGTLFGIIGMFVGVPVVVLVKTLIEEFVENKLNEKKLNEMK